MGGHGAEVVTPLRRSGSNDSQTTFYNYLYMDNPALNILERGVEAWNAWRTENRKVRPNLAGADLRRAELSGADFSRVNFTAADLRWSTLIATDFSEAVLTKADLRKSIIGARLLPTTTSGLPRTRTSFFAADLSNTDLRWATIVGAEFSQSRMNGCNVESSTMGFNLFLDMDLSLVIGLNSVSHVGPSEMSVSTLALSSGKIPENFLRGVGVPDAFISASGNPVQFHSCFISYSTEDQEFADRLYADLQAKGVRCWFAPHDIQSGKKIHEQIEEAIYLHDKLLLILSDNSMSSRWVKTEIANARMKEDQQKRQMLFPISLVPFNRIGSWKLFDADRGVDSAREVREYFIPDFSNWRDRLLYAKAFDRLLRDLKALPADPFPEQPGQ